MIPIAAITEWRREHPWPDDALVEQDLVISRALVELFSRPSISGQVLFRGGTALHKLFLNPPHRYSEDIDLVQAVPAPIGPLFDDVRDVLEPLLGKPQRKQGASVVNLVFRFESEQPPVRPLRLKVEINTREHFSVHGTIPKPFRVESSWFSGQCEVRTYRLEELLGTKMRALYQRNKGRDLYDLWLGLTQGQADPQAVAACFLRYMEAEGHSVSRRDLESNIREKIESPRFAADAAGLLKPDVEWSLPDAGAIVLERLVSML